MKKPAPVYVVMGLLDRHSLAFAIGETLRAHGASIRYVMQNAVLKRRYLDGDPDLTPGWIETQDIRFCDVTDAEQVAALFSDLATVNGVVHSLAYANPQTCLGEEFHTDAIADIQRSYHVSCVSLSTVTQHAVPKMPDGGAIVALSFDAQHAYPMYNWMGVNKAALEALVRALARRHGRDAVRVNAVSSGPVDTRAASKIPGFETILDTWAQGSPLPWDPCTAKTSVAETVAFLLGPGAKLITGQTVVVDGGMSAMGGPLQPFERIPRLS